jgi:hypothetical protein
VAALAKSLIGCDTTVSGGVTAAVQSASSKQISDTFSGIDKFNSRRTLRTMRATELSVARIAEGEFAD